MTTIDAPRPDAGTTSSDSPGPDQVLARLGVGSARELYRALVAEPGSRPELEARAEVVARPNQRAEDLRPGDVLLRVALGEGRGFLAVLVTGELLDRRAAERRGWRLEGSLPGRYAHVVEGGPVPRERDDEWARRIADRDGYLPPGHAVVRLIGGPAEPAPRPPSSAAEWAEAVSRRSPEYVRWYQDALNRVDGAGLIVDGVVGPLTRAAVRRFQRAAGIAVDGVVGPQTERELVARGAPPPPGPAAAGAATFALRLDEDRDGSVDAGPASGAWAWGAGGRGAVILVNNDDDDVDGRPDNADGRVNDASDSRDLAPLAVVRTSPAAAPAGTQVELAVDRRDAIRIFSSRAPGGTEVIGPGTAASFRLPSLAPQRFDFGMEAVRYAGTGFSGEVRITLRVTDPAGGRAETTAVVRVAPWLMPNHLTRAERVFVVDGGSFNAAYRARLRPLVTAAGCTLVEVRATSDIWMQDCMEFGYASLPGAALRTVVRSPQRRELAKVAPSLLDAGMGVTVEGDDAVDTTFDSTGNLECSPPVTSAAGKRYPHGRIYFGPGRPLEPIDDDSREFLRGQVVQEPIEVDTGWLTVGHVDEIISFVPAPGPKGFRMVIASARAAYAILDAIARAEPTARMLLGRSFPYGATSSPVEQTVRDFLGLRSDFLPELRDNIAAGLPYTPKPLRAYNADRQRDLDRVRSTMMAGLGLVDADVVELPSLFMPNPSMPAGADALTGGVVNMLVLNGHCIIPKPFGPHAGTPAEDAFERDIRGKLAPLGLIVGFLDCWDEYHVNLGAVHCSTNTLRAASPARWWEFQP